MSSRQDLMWSSLIQLSSDKKMSYQRQLIEAIVAAILDAKISPHNPLPSSRELAKQLGIARNTVVHAYQQMIDDGYLISRERSGYFVNQNILAGRVASPSTADTADSADNIDWQDKIKLHPSRQRNIVKPIDWNKYPYPFLYGQLDPELFPLQGAGATVTARR